MLAVAIEAAKFLHLAVSPVVVASAAHAALGNLTGFSRVVQRETFSALRDNAEYLPLHGLGSVIIPLAVRPSCMIFWRISSSRIVMMAQFLLRLKFVSW